MNFETIEAKAYVPAKDFELSKRFYTDLGFTVRWAGDTLAYMAAGESAFLLQKIDDTWPAPDGFMMHLLVKDADSWWARIQDVQLAEKYGVKVEPPQDRDWGIRDLVVIDPTGVLWRIGNNIDGWQRP